MSTPLRMSQMRAQSIQLYKMLSKPLNQRMPFQGVQIAKTLQKVLILNKLFDMKSQGFINLCISSHIMQFQPNTDIYLQEQKQGNRYLYVILDGKIDIQMKEIQQVRKVKKTFKVFRSLKSDNNQNNINVQPVLKQPKITTLGQFNIFGHTQIFFRIKQRKQTIISSSPLICIVFSQQKILQIISQQLKSFMKKAFHYLYVNQYFCNLTQFQKQQLVFYMSLQTFKKQQLIVENQMFLKTIIFIINGSINIIKQIDSVNYKIDTLSEMSSYGQYECKNQSMCVFNLAGNSNGSYYLLDYENISKNLPNHPIMKIIQQNNIPYPDQEQLRFLYNVKYALQITQNKVIKNCRLFEYQKSDKKKGLKGYIQGNKMKGVNGRKEGGKEYIINKKGKHK